MCGGVLALSDILHPCFVRYAWAVSLGTIDGRILRSRVSSKGPCCGNHPLPKRDRGPKKESGIRMKGRML